MRSTACDLTAPGVVADPYPLFAEERRLAYVGLTRARRRLYVTRAEHRSLWGQSQYNPASQFLEEIPEQLLEWKREGAVRSAPGAFGSRDFATSRYDSGSYWGSGSGGGRRSGDAESGSLRTAPTARAVGRQAAHFDPNPHHAEALAVADRVAAALKEATEADAKWEPKTSAVVVPAATRPPTNSDAIARA